ncbi:acyltransferase family protein [Homoserinibacter sp. YIM 151385]|uniref:acyltransferase family protein n=1 Tax=Homoserinibacter sp. YIM 151385 TaxID=2985506 RepID=UPI0022F0D68C|nr:acyltransferase family protein [Homoserinibacter sp. YIM 151385]WBU38246.1 acyltransferase family protein [Homoserinibacter sp. YIM 151385]
MTSETTKPAARTATGSIPRPRVRVPLWDNARFACVALVVVGHAIQRQTYDSNNALSLYLFIYAFHMPAFAIISGYFSKAAPPGARQMKKVVTDILLPYVIMETIWTLVKFAVEGDPKFNPTEPSWTLWFLLALAIFRLILPYLALLRGPLVWTLVFSVGVGYLANVDSTFSLSRAIGILPFFVLGWKLADWSLVDRWRNAPTRVVYPVRALALGVFAAWMAVILLNINAFREFDLQLWFFYDDSYQGLGAAVWWAGVLRLGLILLATLLSAAFFALIPRRETWFTAFGQATMYIYLLHSFVLYPIREAGILREEHASATWLLSMVLASLAISMLLASTPVRRLFRPIIEPKPRWIFRDGSDAPARESRTDPTGARRR